MNKNTETATNDFSEIFNIDNDNLPKELIEKDPDASKRNLGFLSEDNINPLSEKEKKEVVKKAKKADKKLKANLFKNRLIVVLLAIVMLFVAATVTKIIINEKQKPVIETEKPVVQTLSRYTTSTGVTISSGTSYRVVFIDNEYDVHYISTGQSAELYDENGNVYHGTVTDIRSVTPDAYYVQKYPDVLVGEIPSTSVYAVFISLEESGAFTKEGIKLSIKIFTKTVQDALTVSEAAIFTENDIQYVWIYSPLRKNLIQQEVKTGLTVDGITQITYGIEKNDKIAISFSCDRNKLFDGIQVKTK